MKWLAVIQMLLLIGTSIVPDGYRPTAATQCAGQCGCSKQQREKGSCCCSGTRSSSDRSDDDHPTTKKTSTSCCSRSESSRDNFKASSSCCSASDHDAANSERCCSKKSGSSTGRTHIPAKPQIGRCPCGDASIAASVLHAPRVAPLRTQIPCSVLQPQIVMMDGGRVLCERDQPPVPPPRRSCC